MTPLPKRRHSHARTGKRRAAIKLTLPDLVTCSNPTCGQPTLPHQVCLNCGQYDGKQIIASTK